MTSLMSQMTSQTSPSVFPDILECLPQMLLSSPTSLSVLPNIPKCLLQHLKERQGRHVFPNISGKDREDIDFPDISRKIGKACLPQHLKEDREDMSSMTSRGRQGRHVFPDISRQRQGRHDFPDISRKTGKTCLPQNAREDGEDMSSPKCQGRWGRHCPQCLP